MVVQTYGTLIFHNYITTDAIIDTQKDRIKLNAAQRRQNTGITSPSNLMGRADLEMAKGTRTLHSDYIPNCVNMNTLNKRDKISRKAPYSIL